MGGRTCGSRGASAVLVVSLGAAAALAQMKAEPAPVAFHVSPAGSDANPGSARRPFATLGRARDALRASRKDAPREVVLHSGAYRVGATLELGPRDSGTAAHPVTWRALAGSAPRLIGGATIPPASLRPVADPAVRSRLDAGARSHVLCADIGRLNVPLPPFSDAYHGPPPGPEAFWNGARMTVARWPNSGWATISRILESGSRPRDGDRSGRPGAFEFSGDRPARWRVENGVWLQGYWCYDWYDEVIRIGSIDATTRRIGLAAPHVYSIMQGNPSPRRYRALNVLEELDQPGEYYLDRDAQRLYCWPPGPVVGAEIVVSTLSAPLVALRGASHIALRSLTFEAGLEHAIEVVEGRSCSVIDCRVRNMRGTGIRVVGGQQHMVRGCDIHDTGAGGLLLSGGDRRSLAPGRHLAADNHIRRFSVHQLTSAYGLSFEGVGNRAVHNLIEDAPHQAVFVGGNDHVFELNEVRHVCTETDDCGALYKGRNPSCRGNMIRWNYWHDIGRPMGHGSAAVYFDDGDGGDTVYGNVFVRCGDPGRGGFGAVFSHGGHDNIAENSIFIGCKRAIGSAPWSDERWRDALAGGQDCFFPRKLLEEVDITKPPYTIRYPELLGYMDPPAGAARANHSRGNAFVDCGETLGGNWRNDGTPDWSTKGDPGFADMRAGDYRLRPRAELLRGIPGFRPIPFERIGLTAARRRSSQPGRGLR